MKKHADLSFIDEIVELRAIPPLVIDLMTLLNDSFIAIDSLQNNNFFLHFTTKNVRIILLINKC